VRIAILRKLKITAADNVEKRNETTFEKELHLQKEKSSF
jgi:hypothetical protein